MNSIDLMTISGTTVALPLTEVDRLAEQICGPVLRAGDEGYDVARVIWNAMIDKRPALIVSCVETGDVVRTVNFARENRLLLAVRGGGHNIAGSALCDGGIVLDLSQMKAVTVDTEARRATVEAGATLAEFDAATQAFGLATPLGINSTTGIAGLTLGGGIGWLSRKYGLTIDNLVSAEVVTAAGTVVRASASEHPDLFWALRGGGGNFGVVTRFEFALHPVGPNLLSGLIVYPISEARAVLQQYRDFIANAPNELSVWVVMRKAPPLPFLPAEAHGTDILALALLYTGDPNEGSSIIEPLRKFGNPVGEHVGVQPFVAWQQAFDPLLTPGARNYWKSHNFTSLDDGLFDTAIEYLKLMPSPHSEIFLASIGGATARPAPRATAYAPRDAQFVINVHGRWLDDTEDERCILWARSFFNATSRFATGGAHMNFMTADEKDRVPAAYGPNYGRLAQVKRTYDPGNMFRVNQNIQPA